MATDWTDQRARLREALDALSDRMDDPDCSAAELASLARERRITLSELVQLGDEDVEQSGLDEIAERRRNRLAGK